MKQLIINFLRKCSDTYLQMGPGKHLRPQTPPPAATRHVAIMTSSSYGNLGDEAMALSTVLQLRAKDPNLRITLLLYKGDDSSEYDALNVETVSTEGYFGKFPKSEACKRLGALMETVTDVIVLGADVLDGRYSESRSFRRLHLAEVAQASPGRRGYVLGFSFSDKATPRMRQYFAGQGKDLTLVCRDPLSAQRLTEITGREVPHGADLAFLLPIPDTPASAEARRAHTQMEAWKAEGRKVIVINANPVGILTAKPDVDIEQAAMAYVESLKAVAKASHCGFLLLTHDNRPGPHSDAAFMQRIFDRIKDDTTCHFVPETISPMDIKWLCRQVDLTVTGRMHLGIASLGGGTPTMVLDYQGKVQGLMRLFDMPEMILNVDDLLDAPKFTQIVSDRLAAHETLAEQVQRKLGSVHTLSARHVQTVIG